MKAKNIIGIDTGGTFIKMGVVTPCGQILKRRIIPTPEGADYRVIARAVKELASSSVVSSAGIGVPGFVDAKKGIVHKLVNIPGWDNVPLKRLIQKAAGIPICVDNDVNCVVLGELKFGIAKGKKNIVGITLGTGVGGGIIIGGRIYRGAALTAGEVGHIPVLRNGPRCSCGSRGCLEALVGNRRIIALGKRSPERLQKDARRGDKGAIRIWNEVGSYIGIALAGIVNVLNPELIIIGGGVAKAGSLIMKNIRAEIKKRAVPVAKDAVAVEFSRLGNDAGILGAAALCMK